MGAQEQGRTNRSRVFSEILFNAGGARTDIARNVDLNIASVSRISRDLIEAGLVDEGDPLESKGRPGRRFVGLTPCAEGGYIIGIGLNAFRQSVTLANLRNEKIAEWISPQAPTTDGQTFLRTCLQHAKRMVEEHVPDRRRFFGIGIAIAANLDKAQGTIVNAPVFGWSTPVVIKDMVKEELGVALAMDTPSSAINKAEAQIGLGKGVTNLTTLHCSLGYGIGIRQANTSQGLTGELGAVLTQSFCPDGSSKSLSEACGGLSILKRTHGADGIAGRSDWELARLLIEVIDRAISEVHLQEALHLAGAQTAAHLALLFDLCPAQRLLLSGPLATSQHYVNGFRTTLKERLARPESFPEIDCSIMTPTGASRWLALRETVALADLYLNALKPEKVS